MQTFVKNAIVGLSIAATFLFISVSAQAQVLAHSGDAAGYGGYVNVGSGGGNHAYFGGSGGYNLAPSVTVFGEYSYVPLPDSAHVQLYGGGARFNFLTSTKVVPYAVAAFGGGHGSIDGASGNGWYAGFGGGASIFCGKNWGVRPEYRYERVESSGSGVNNSVIVGGVFYQWGGTGSKKKAVSAQK